MTSSSTTPSTNPSSLTAVLVFICTGNTCRSPMAEFYAKHLLKTLNAENQIAVYSRGVSVRTGESSLAQNAFKVLEQKTSLPKNILQKHIATPLQKNDIPPHPNTFYLCMTESHRKILLDEIGNGSVSLAQGCDAPYLMMGNSESLPDPYGGDLNEYQKCFQSIEHWVKRIIPNVIGGKKGMGIFDGE